MSFEIFMSFNNVPGILRNLLVLHVVALWKNSATNVSLLGGLKNTH